MAKTTKAATATEHEIEEFAEDLGRLLGSATAKADRWLGQRRQIVKHLTEVRDTASKLLNDLGHKVAEVPLPLMLGKRLGRPAGSKNKAAAAKSSPATTQIAPHIHSHEPAAVERKQRTMSAKARKAISMAQKARWARQKGAGKKT